MVALLAHRPLRLANLTQIAIGRHLVRRGAGYWLCFGSEETKDRLAMEMPVPVALTLWIDRYLEIIRPVLLAGAATDRLWITVGGRAMPDNTVYQRITKLTDAAFGRPINPHLFRDCAATLVAEEAPEEIRIVARLLGHACLRTSERHYNQAGMLSAQAQYDRELAARRGR